MAVRLIVLRLAVLLVKSRLVVRLLSLRRRVSWLSSRISLGDRVFMSDMACGRELGFDETVDIPFRV